MEAYLIWLVSAAACAVGIVALRSVRLRRRPRRADLSWGGVIGLSLLAGALPAIVYVLMPGPVVEVPEAVLERTMPRVDRN